MPIKQLDYLRQDNAKILNSVRYDASLDYQRRVPRATQANLQDVLRSVMDYTPNRNEFINVFINQVGTVIARTLSWDNPLAEFKRGLMQTGDTVQEIYTGVLQAHTYDHDRDTTEQELWGTELPETQVNWHSINRQEMFKFTVNEMTLRRAFLTEDGLREFISQLMSAPITSDNWNEFLTMCQLIPEYEANGGFYHVNVGNVSSYDSDSTDAKRALRKVRAMADTLPFLSSRYNAAHMPVFANRDDLILLSSPEFNAAVDVEALAGAFNIDRASMHGRQVTIPREQFGVDGAEAILTTKDFWVVLDTLIENASIYNPAKLSTNHFFHHHSIISASRFVPTVMFGDIPDDEVITVSTPVTGIETPRVVDRDGATITEVARGNLYDVIAKAVTTPENGDNDAVRWSVEGNSNDDTFITEVGVLHVGPREEATSLVVRATTTWLNEDNVREDGKTATVTVTVTGEKSPLWPTQGRISRILVRDNELAFSSSTLAYETGAPAPLTADDVEVFTVGGGSTRITADPAGEFVTVTYDAGVGAATAYTLNAALGSGE